MPYGTASSLLLYCLGLLHSLPTFTHSVDPVSHSFIGWTDCQICLLTAQIPTQVHTNNYNTYIHRFTSSKMQLRECYSLAKQTEWGKDILSKSIFCIKCWYDDCIQDLTCLRGLSLQVSISILHRAYVNSQAVTHRAKSSEHMSSI